MWKTSLMLMFALMLVFHPCFSEPKTSSGVWNRIELGTNLIPLIDSSTLKFDNLMLKYYYDASHSKAFRLNWKYSDVSLDFYAKQSLLHKAKHCFEVGHVWRYNLKEKVGFFQAVDIGLNNTTNTSSSHGTFTLFDRKHNINTISLSYSLGIKYCLGRGFSIELETSLMALLKVYYYGGYDLNIEPPKYNKRFICFGEADYFPLKHLTINYKF